MSEKLNHIIKQIIDGTELPEAEMRIAFEEIMEGHASPVELASFLVSLRMRGETPRISPPGPECYAAKPCILMPRMRQWILLARAIKSEPIISLPQQRWWLRTAGSSCQTWQ